MLMAEVPESNGGYLVPLAYNTKNNSVLVPPEGFKPPITSSVVRRVIQLHYEGIDAGTQKTSVIAFLSLAN